jgi:hypothetical protein
MTRAEADAPRSRAALAVATAALATAAAGCRSAHQDASAGFVRPDVVPTRAPLHPPRTYDAPFAESRISIDGQDVDAAWDSAPWSEAFVDIEGSDRPAPRHLTRMKMCWDDTHLYALARMEEPHLWATYSVRDQIVFHENDIEIFIDPDGDSLEYYEIEVNAIGTVFDLQLRRPYRSGGPALHEWNTPGLKVGIHLDGTVNDPSDTDAAWTCEMAIPWTALRPLPDPTGAPVAQRVAMPPAAGDTWRINFSRVQWDIEPSGRGYRKVEGRPEWNWVWSPQWIIDMHVPWQWGQVTFVRPGSAGRKS